MAGAPVAVQLQADIKPGPGIGSGSGPGVGAGTEAGIPTRSMITAAAARGSGGLSVASGGVSRDSGGAQPIGKYPTVGARVPAEEHACMLLLLLISRYFVFILRLSNIVN